MLLAPLAAAQVHLYSIEDSGDSPEFCGIGDVDADGHDDFAYLSATVRVVSGADGATVLLDLFPLGTLVRSLAGAGDVDGDGKPDLIVGAPTADVAGMNAGFVMVVSGADASLLHTLYGLAPDERLGHDVASVGDLDGDGVPDFLASAGNYNPMAFTDHGLVRLYSGADGSILHEWIGPTDTERFGFTVARAGDVDADGRTDVMIGSLDHDLLRVYSGHDFSELHELEATPYDIEPAGDLDGDGHDDVGSLWGWPAGGYLRVFSGATGAKIRDFHLTASFSLFDKATSIGTLGDVNGDGVPDYVLGRTGQTPDVSGYVQVKSGATGGSLWTSNDESSYGLEVDVVGDLDGNGLPDYGASSAGRITFLTGNGQPVATFAQGPVEGATPATLTAFYFPPLEFLRFTAQQLPPGAPAFFIVGLAQVDQPFQGGTLVPSPDALVGPFVVDAAGQLEIEGRWPEGLPLYLSAWFQAWAPDAASPSGFRATNGLVITEY